VQRAGIGRKLLEHVCSRCRSRGRRILTVNAAPNAVSAYEHLGFSAQGPEHEESGIRSVPMMRAVDESP
jgi:predicted GNAT family N-acyltransferase